MTLPAGERTKRSNELLLLVLYPSVLLVGDRGLAARAVAAVRSRAVYSKRLYLFLVCTSPLLLRLLSQSL